MSTIVVTGAAGLLGTHFSRHLLSKGHKVVGIDNLLGGYQEFVDPRVDFIVRDLENARDVNRIFEARKPDYVYHFAAYAALGLSPFIRNFNYQNNVIASVNLINASINHGVKKFIFTSSMDVYGSRHQPPYTEEMTPEPEDPYGIAKYAVEMDLKHASRFFGLRQSIVRPHNVFGIYQNIWDKYRNVLGIWIRQIIAGKDITVYGDGSQVRSFSDVAFYMDPFEELMDLGDGETYNIGAEAHTTILRAAERVKDISAVFGYNPKIVHVEKRDEVHTAYCDHSKAKRDLGFEDGTNFSQLVMDMFNWARSEPARLVRDLPLEVDKNLYSFWKK